MTCMAQHTRASRRSSSGLVTRTADVMSDPISTNKWHVETEGGGRQLMTYRAVGRTTLRSERDRKSAGSTRRLRLRGQYSRPRSRALEDGSIARVRV